MRIITTSFTLLLVGGLLAQPAFQAAQLPSSTITLGAYLLLNTDELDPPTPGVAQVWDYNDMQLAHVGTFSFGPASATPYASSYPQATHAVATNIMGESPSLAYLAADNTGLDLLVEGVPDGPNLYSDPKRLVQFNLPFGGSFSDSYASPDESGNIIWTFVGYGTLITPLGTFTDQMILASNDDQVFIWNPSPLFPRLVGDGDTPVLLGPVTTGVAEQEDAAQLQLFPVPARDHLQVKGATAGGIWMVHDLVGRQLLQGQWAPAGERSVDVSALAPGRYLLQVRNGEGVRTVRFDKL